MNDTIKINQANLHTLRLRFFDTVVSIRSDTDQYQTLFAQMYQRFLFDQTSSAPDLTFTILTSADNAWGHPVLLVKDQVLPIPNEGFAYESILSTIIAHIRSHILIHAGVVTYRDQSIIIAADSGHGKTTLVLTLLRRGCNFLSDEMAALGRTDNQVHPFPRSLRLRPDTLKRVGFEDALQQDISMWWDKLLVDIEQIKPDCMGKSTKLSHIIFLKDPQASPDDETQQQLGLLVDRIDETLITSIEALEGVHDVVTGTDRGYNYIKLRAVSRTSSIPKIEQLCQQQKIVLLDIVKRKPKPPTFEAEPYLEQIPSSRATLELLRHFRGGYHSNLVQQDFGGSSKQMFIELMPIVGQATCHHLYVGSLSKMANLVSQLVGLNHNKTY